MTCWNTSPRRLAGGSFVAWTVLVHANQRVELVPFAQCRVVHTNQCRVVEPRHPNDWGINFDVGVSSTVNFEKDLEADHALGDGWTNSYLLPVKRATIQLTDAGQRSAFGSPRNFYLDYPNSGGGNKTFTNSDMTVSEGDTLNVRGRYLSGDLVKEFGATIGGARTTTTERTALARESSSASN